MVKNLIDFFITIGLLLPQFFGFIVDLLQFFQPKLNIINTGFIRSLIGKLGWEDSPETLKLWQSISSTDWDLVLRQKAWNRNVESWNWSNCQ